MTNKAQNTEMATRLVREYLTDNNSTDVALARKLGVSGSAVSSWRIGPTAPLQIEYAMGYLMNEPAAKEAVRLQAKVDRLHAQILRMDAMYLVNAKPEPELYDLSTFKSLRYQSIWPQRLRRRDNIVILDCRSSDIDGVSVSKLGIEALEKYQELGRICIVRLESKQLGWIREVALDDLPRKKYSTWADGKMGTVIDLWDIDPDEVEPIPDLD